MTGVAAVALAGCFGNDADETDEQRSHEENRSVSSPVDGPTSDRERSETDDSDEEIDLTDCRELEPYCETTVADRDFEGVRFAIVIERLSEPDRDGIVCERTHDCFDSVIFEDLFAVGDDLEEGDSDALNYEDDDELDDAYQQVGAFIDALTDSFGGLFVENSDSEDYFAVGLDQLLYP